jgi:hypothetical protein
VQALGLLLSVTFLFSEVLNSRINVWVFFIIVTVFWFALVTVIFPMTTAFISEALFYPLLIMMCALLLRFLRTKRFLYFYLIICCVVFAIFTRSAAFALLPVTVFLLIIFSVWGKDEIRGSSLKAIVLTILLIGFIPVLLGRGMFETGALADRKGFVFIARVTMIPANLPIQEASRMTWARINGSFIDVGETLTCGERSMYESQLQEAVRYYIAPKLFFQNAAFWSASAATPVKMESSYKRAFDLFKIAAMQEPVAYSASVACHFWALLTAGTHIGSESRTKVFNAVRAVDSETWRLARLRSDYPLQRYDIPLKSHTELIFLGFRVFSFFATLTGVAGSAFLLVGAVMWSRRLDYFAVVWLLLTGWLIGHSLLIALSVFPDTRFVMANFIIQWVILVLAATQILPNHVGESKSAS